MNKKNFEISYDILEVASNKIDCSILDIVFDSASAIKIVINTYNCISDKIFCFKIDKFVKTANQFESSKSFDKFKKKISENESYKSRVSEYLLFKINKFDADYKLKVFSRACVDFFSGNINENILIEISETIDYITSNDIELIKYMYSFGDKLIPIKSIIDENSHRVDNFKTYSSILKLINLGLILEELDQTWDALENKQQKKVVLSPLGKTFYKYLI